MGLNNMGVWGLRELANIRRSSGESILEYTLGTRVMTGLCIVGEVLSFFIPLEDVPSALLFFVVMLGVVFWMGVYSDAIRLLEAMIEKNSTDQRFFVAVGSLDVLMLFASLPLLWRLPAYGTNLYVIVTLPVGIVVVFLSTRRLFNTIQRVRLTRH